MDHDHVMAILSAAEQGDVSTVCSFLKEGQGDVSDAEGTSPLMSAAANGRDSVLRVLLQVSLVWQMCNFVWYVHNQGCVRWVV